MVGARIATHAVNMPAPSPGQYRALGPYATLAGRLGNFIAHIASGNPHTVFWLGRRKKTKDHATITFQAPTWRRLRV